MSSGFYAPSKCTMNVYFLLMVGMIISCSASNVFRAGVAFSCPDPNNCLDGSSFTPSLGQCVAVGKFNMTMVKSDGQDYLLSTPSGDFTFLNQSMSWFLKAVQFSRKCIPFQTASPSLDGVDLLNLCSVYRDSEGTNLCVLLDKDPRCELDDGLNISRALAHALFAQTLSVRSEMQRAICQCSCASEIRQIYGTLLKQWALLNDAIAPSI